MENDMSLLQQLLTLGDQITEMKKLKEQSMMRKCQSHTSLGDDDDDDSEVRLTSSRSGRFHHITMV